MREIHPSYQNRQSGRFPIKSSRASLAGCKNQQTVTFNVSVYKTSGELLVSRLFGIVAYILHGCCGRFDTTVVWCCLTLLLRRTLTSTMGISVLSQIAMALGVFYAVTQIPNADSTPCSVIPSAVTVSHPGCLSVTVQATICSGMCTSTSKPLLHPPFYKMTVNCCSTAREVDRNVTMYCPGEHLKTIKVVTKCACRQCSTL